MKTIVLSPFLFVLLFNSYSSENLVGGKPCDFSPKPNYRLCTDPADTRQLTDGERSSGQFWTKKSTVGWTHVDSCEMTFDLGRVRPISGASFSTAAGVGNVDWPVAVWIAVSDDKDTWYPVGDLVSDSIEGSVPIGGKGVRKHTFESKNFRSFGRYVKFVAITKGSCVFADELEVYSGEKEYLQQSRATSFTDVAIFSRQAKIHGLMTAQFREDLKAIATDIATFRGTKAARPLIKEWEGLKKLIGGHPPPVSDDFRAVLPMNTLERDIFRLQAKVWLAQGKSPVRIWKTHKWGKLLPSDEPVKIEPFSLQLHLGADEVRSEAVNLNLAFPGETGVVLSLVGFGQELSEQMEIERVLHTGSRLGGTICSALLPLKRDGTGFGVNLEGGMAHQFWIRVRSGATPPGVYRGHLVLQVGGDQGSSVPFTIIVYPIRKTSQKFYVCGWDYTNKPTYDLTEASMPEAIRLLSDAGVNMTWASKSAMPRGTFSGYEYREAPNTDEFDRWVKRWPDAERYAIYLGVSKSRIDKASFASSEIGTKGFEERLKTWTRFWSKHVRSLGIPPEKVVLHVCDEPRSFEQFKAIEAWSRIIKEAEPRFVLMNTPRPEGLETDLMDELKSIDLLLPNRSELNTGQSRYRSYFSKRQAKGMEVGLYACRDPVRKFDPWFFFGAHFWRCYQLGGNTGGFWAFSDSSGSKNLNEYDAGTRGPYTPLFLAGDDVLGSKYLEAIREGVQDARLFVSSGLPRDDDRLERAVKLSALANWGWDKKSSYKAFDDFRRGLFAQAAQAEQR